MGTTLRERLNVPVALLAFGLRRFPMGVPPVVENRVRVLCIEENRHPFPNW